MALGTVKHSSKKRRGAARREQALTARAINIRGSAWRGHQKYAAEMCIKFSPSRARGSIRRSCAIGANPTSPTKAVAAAMRKLATRLSKR